MMRGDSFLPNARLTDSFISTLNAACDANSRDDPNYYVQDTHSLVTTSSVHSFATGTGNAIYRSLSPLLESITEELILVTCFWARSSTLNALNDILRNLSDKAVRRGTEKIRVRLCFSSSSLFQKLFHKQSAFGQTYDPSTWVKQLGLLPPSELGGLDVQIKSIFFLPFSVMHPKFIIIDRRLVVLPSCNVSWEEWFEGCITFSGQIVSQFLHFYQSFWARVETVPQEHTTTRVVGVLPIDGARTAMSDLGRGHIIKSFATSVGSSDIKNIPTIFLPSPHRRDPKFRPFLHADKIVARPTPLNTFILVLFAKAEKRIRIQTPNVTSPPVLSGLLQALARGIDVTILTSERLMILEQLVTAGTTTSRCVKNLIKRYKNLPHASLPQGASDEEAAISAPQPGNLQISFFAPAHGPKLKGKEEGEPQQSHLKMIIVDDNVLVLGSGNLDRASWFTSQELGVAFFDKTLLGEVEVAVDEAMTGRTKTVFDSRT